MQGRFIGRLNLARERGFLNAVCQNPAPLLRAYARWCWHLRLPVVWTERLSPYSRFGRVRLDLFTTPYRLSAEAQMKLRDLAPGAATSPHDGCWMRVRRQDLDRLAASVLRIILSSGSLQLNSAYPPAIVPNEVRYIDERAAG